MFSVGCAGSDEAAPALDLGMGGAPPMPQAGPCEEGEQRECSIVIHQASGVKSCFTGVEFCVDGEWSDCLEP